MDEYFDLVILGGGPAGYTAAAEAARQGMKTALVESRQIGGTCLNRGCIPTKTLLHGAELYSAARQGDAFGVCGEGIRCDLAKLQAHKRTVVSQLQEGILSQMKKHKVTVVCGTGRIADGHTVRVLDSEGRETSRLGTEHILITTGSAPSLPPVPGLDLPDVITSDELLERETLYPSLIIIGGGVIGMEFASLYSALGCRVTVIEFLDRILANMDKEISQSLKMLLKKRGVEIHTGARVISVTEGADGKKICHFVEKEKEGEAAADGILVAAGRRPCTEGLFDEGFEVDAERGKILTDENGQTSVPGVYAAGDVTGGIMLAHAASAEAVNAVLHMAGKPPRYHMDAVPGCVYTDPEIASVGLTQDEAKKQGLDVISHKYPMTANGKSVLSCQERGFIRVVADSATHQILGAQMMCARATDMISQFTMAIENGLTLEQMGKVIYPHPTFGEAVGETVLEMIRKFPL